MDARVARLPADVADADDAEGPADEPVPMYPVFSAQRPSRVSRSLASSRCESASTSVSAEVATGRRTASGVTVTTMPACVQASSGTLS